MGAKQAAEFEMTREVSFAQLQRLGLPSSCRGGKVLEDRLIERNEDDATVQTHELRFVIFRLEDGSMWGVPYTKHEDGHITFDDKTQMTRYVRKSMLVPATNT